MKIVVIGGTGLIGSKVVKKLYEQGHEAVAAAPNTGVNTVTGQGLAEALANAQVVVDVSNSPSFADDAVMKFFQTTTANIVAAEKSAGVGHHVALSIVNVEMLPESGYFRAKLAQEKLIKESKIPYSIVRATQFFEFLKATTDEATRGDVVHVAPVLTQSIAAEDVASAVAGVAMGAPLNGTVQVAGPEQIRFDRYVERGLRANRDSRKVVADAAARYFGSPLGERSLIPGADARLGKIRFDEWLSQQQGQRA